MTAPKTRFDAATPGPWRYDDGCLAGNIRDGVQDCIVHLEPEDVLRSADAMLIAAAPDILRVGQDLAAALENMRRLEFNFGVDEQAKTALVAWKALVEP